MATYTGSDKRLAYLFERTEDMQGATSEADGAQGIIPKPEAGDNLKFFRGDGTWAEVGEEFDEEETKIGTYRNVTVYQKTFWGLSDSDFELVDSDTHRYRFDTGISGNWQLLSLDCTVVTPSASMLVYPCGHISEIWGSPLSPYLYFTRYTGGSVFLRIKYVK